MTSSGLDAVLAPDFLDGLSSWPTAEVRERRAECEAHEAAVSYARRVLQGRLDIVRAELERRAEGGEDVAGLLTRLPSLLAGDHVPTSQVHARVSRLEIPEAAEGLVAELGADLDPTNLTDLDSDELTALVDRLETQERELSSCRHELFERIDAIRDELAARYKDGRADVGDLLTGS